jgi:hypothetical protein
MRINPRARKEKKRKKMRSGQSQLESQVEAAGARSIYVVHRARFLLFPFLKIDE